MTVPVSHRQLWFHFLPETKDTTPGACNDPHLWEQPYFSEAEAREALNEESIADGWIIVGPYILTTAPA